MEINRWKKDETPYLIFSCTKCKRWLYAKPTQKSKKCLNCGRSQKTQGILDKAETVFGLNNAILTVKQKQNEMALSELGQKVDLRTENTFFIQNKTSLTNNLPRLKSSNEENYESTFKALLNQLSKKYSQFPKYLIYLLANEYKIPEHEQNLLIRKYKSNGLLIPLKNNYFSLKKSSH